MALIQGFPFLFGCGKNELFIINIFINLFFWIATSVFIFKILNVYLNKKKAFLISSMNLVLIGSAICVFDLLAENIYIFFIVLAIFFLQKHYTTYQFKYLAFCLSILVFSMLIKPGSKLLALCFVIFYFRQLIRNYKQKSMSFFYASWMLVMFQCYSVKQHYGDFTISYIDSITYYNYLGSKASCLKEGKELDQSQNPRGEYFFSLKYDEMGKVAFNDVLNQIENNTFNLVYAYMSDVYDNSTAGNTALYYSVNLKSNSYFESFKAFFFKVSKWQNRIITFIGFFLAVFLIYKFFRSDKVIVACSFFVLYTIFLSGISCSQGDRFHFVFYPFVLILVGKLISVLTPSSEPLQK
ncbi:hypothetical protein [Flavobacterium sp.]|uniref:hypothetical protein n=1 Tax=Flavobacterium sp. TaxID=239 RepID=UPI002B4B7462|nr:hypothetical protein [Flavobacterium sp.]HLP63159.1 hypothetical protein [Flavobacterium sp.]